MALEFFVPNILPLGIPVTAAYWQVHAKKPLDVP